MSPENAKVVFGGTLPRPATLRVSVLTIGATGTQAMVRFPDGSTKWVSTMDLALSR